MILALTFFVAATVCGIASTSVAQWIAPTLLPQVGLLAVAAWTYRRGGAASVLGAWAVGWSFDALSAAAPGTHAFLFLLAWMATRFASHQVQLRSASAFALYLFCLSLGMTAVSSLAMGRPPLSASLLVPALIQALVNGASAAPFRWLLWQLLERFEEGEPIRSTGLGSGASLS